jgi:hypothetical protein
MMYDPLAVASYFDDIGSAEWDRLVRTPVEEITLSIPADGRSRNRFE